MQLGFMLQHRSIAVDFTLCHTNEQHQRSNIIKSFIKIVNKETPAYLQNLLPKQIGEVRPNSRQADNFFLYKTRTETFRKSFFPSSVKIWNNTPAIERDTDFIKTNMSKKSTDLFNFGSRNTNIKHAQLRLQCI